MPSMRRNFTLSASVHELLTRTENASGYLDHVVQERWRAWQEALLELQQSGWRAPEILAACDVLNGYWALGAAGRSGQAVALELHDGAQLNGICEKWDVSPERWATRIKTLSESDLHAAALLTVVSEFWAGNAACDAAIRRVK